MTRDRFSSILQLFHLCDNYQALPVDHENHDRLLKIRTSMEGIIIPLWQGAYYPGKEVAVDETLLHSRVGQLLCNTSQSGGGGSGD